MNIVGIIVEYNPFHNGHIYHLQKIKEMFPNSIIIAVMSGNFTQRGIPSILSKDEKKEIALNFGIDLVIELPFIFATQSADIFADAGVKILNILKVNYIVFGSEENNIDRLIKCAKEQLDNPNYNNKVKKYLKEGINYPTALSKALKSDINTPNDILALSYIKSIIKNNFNIKPISIKRTNNYNSKKTSGSISSATSIREELLNKKNISKYVPKNVNNLLKNKNKIEYFNYLKLKIITEGKSINKYLTVDEGIENRILKVIDKCNNLDELIDSVKTKRYTYNKLSRMFTHILCSLTKEDVKNNKDISYIKVLSFNKIGQKYLNSIKKDLNYPLITNDKYYKDLLEIETKVDKIYNLITK